MDSNDKHEETLANQPTPKKRNVEKGNPTDRQDHEGSYNLQGDSAQARGRGVDHERAHSNTAYDRGHADHDIQKEHSDGIPEHVRMRIALENELQAVEELDTTNIRVEYADGVVILDGAVDDQTQRELAAQMLEQIDGVTHVDNQLRVIGGLLGAMGKGDTNSNNPNIGIEADTDNVIPTVQGVAPTNRVR